MPNYKPLYEQLFDAIEILRKAQINTADTCCEELKKERNEKLRACPLSANPQSVVEP